MHDVVLLGYLANGLGYYRFSYVGSDAAYVGNYIVNGKMIGGFALVAYPAEYGNSGVMTFLVNHAGAVFEKDLGPETAEIANRMTTFRPRSDLEKSKCGQRGQMSGGAASLICVGSLGYRAGGIVGNIRSRQSNSLGRLRRDGSRTGRIDSIAALVYSFYLPLKASTRSQTSSRTKWTTPKSRWATGRKLKSLKSRNMAPFSGKTSAVSACKSALRAMAIRCLISNRPIPRP
jgi:hypothetical protein